MRLEELRGLRDRVRCTWLRHESLRIVTSINRALLREARVTIARRQTSCGRGIAALAARGMKQMLQSVGTYDTVNNKALHERQAVGYILREEVVDYAYYDHVTYLWTMWSRSV